jgi:hypothetical protein
MAVNEGRWTASLDGDFVVFLIGARIGNPLKSWRAVPLLLQMRAMLADLEKAPDKGLLAYQQHGVSLTTVQYWRSFEHLERFARDPEDRHSKTWREWFRRAQHKNPSAGIWHETFQVHAGEYEAIYQNMPAIGLLKAGTPTRVGGARTDTARERIGSTVPAQMPAPVRDSGRVTG